MVLNLEDERAGIVLRFPHYSGLFQGPLVREVTSGLGLERP